MNGEARFQILEIETVVNLCDISGVPHSPTIGGNFTESRRVESADSFPLG